MPDNEPSAAADWGEVGELRVRMAINAGEAVRTGADWFGPALNRTARLLGIGHGGQILLSASAHALLADGLPPETSLKGLGSHRLRDLVEREDVWGVVAPRLPSDFPPLRSSDVLSGNLPAQLTAFFGRGRELEDLTASLVTGRIVTLVGSGGMGKTRLALQAAADVADKFPDGVWFVDLASVRTADAVDHALASTLGVEPRGDLGPRELTISQLSRSRTLLVIDNCEHVIDAVADLVAVLIRQCPGLVVLATSRIPLHVTGERLRPLGPLGASEAYELFVDRALAVRPDFELTDEASEALATACGRLDHMPLALELAAARMRSMTISELAQRLDGRLRLLHASDRTTNVRHATLQAVVDWSYELLDPTERQLLASLSVFAGGFDLDAAHSVCAVAEDDLATLDLLDRLVESSLVVHEQRKDSSRYRLLETIREYGALRLDQSITGELRRRHALHYSNVLASPRAPRTVVVQQETDNIRAAVTFALAENDPVLALSIVGPLWSYVIIQLTMLEAEQWAHAALALQAARDCPQARWAEVLISWTRFMRGDMAGGERHALAALAIESRLSLEPHPQPWMALSNTTMFQGKTSEAAQAAAKAAEIALDQGRHFGRINALSNLIQCLIYDEPGPDAELVAEIVRLAEQEATPAAQVMADHALAAVLTQSDPKQAAELYERAYQGAKDAGLLIWAQGSGIYAHVLRHNDAPVLALQGLHETLERWRENGLDFAVRITLREHLHAFAQLGCYEVVAVIDGAALPFVRCFKAAHEAVALARSEIGIDEYETAKAKGSVMAGDALAAYLRAELAAVGVTAEPVK